MKQYSVPASPVTKNCDLLSIPFEDKTSLYPELEIFAAYKYPRQSTIQPPKITDTKSAVKVFRNIWNKSTLLLSEDVYMLCLNKAGQLVGWHHLSKGGIDSTLIDVRLVAMVAIKTGACKVVLAHNHPSGNVRASHADVDITIKIERAFEYLDLTLQDHIIITDSSHLSFRDNCMIG